MPEPTPPVWSGLVSGLRIFYLFSSSRPPCFPRPFLISPSPPFRLHLAISLSLTHPDTRKTRGLFLPLPTQHRIISYIVLLLAVLTGATWLRTGHHLVSARLLPTIFYITSTFHYYLSWLLLPLLPNKHMY
ncbi:hypothetical protein HDV62DRAFT_114461 [Trichoderma sp. SZMC 28011]